MAWWLVVGDDPLREFTVERDGAMALPVFSFREEAEMFARIEAGVGWVVWEMRAEDLLLMLREVSAVVEHIFLDPLPSAFGGEMPGLVRLGLERFEDLILTRSLPDYGQPTGW